MPLKILTGKLASYSTVINNLSRPGRHLMQAIHYRLFRDRSFVEWDRVSGVQNLD